MIICIILFHIFQMILLLFLKNYIQNWVIGKSVLKFLNPKKLYEMYSSRILLGLQQTQNTTLENLNDII